MIDHKKRLEEALRQYRHNNSDEFVAGYDLQLIAKLVDDLVQDNDDLRVQCGGMQLTIDELKAQKPAAWKHPQYFDTITESPTRVAEWKLAGLDVINLYANKEIAEPDIPSVDGEGKPNVN